MAQPLLAPAHCQPMGDHICRLSTVDGQNGLTPANLELMPVLPAGLIYTVNIGLATGGTFLLTVDSKTTAPLAWNVSYTNLRTALTNAGITTTAVTGTGALATPWVITFTGAPTAVTMDKTAYS
jgi:hypothetical protein